MSIELAGQSSRNGHSMQVKKTHPPPRSSVNGCWDDFLPKSGISQRLCRGPFDWLVIISPHLNTQYTNYHSPQQSSNNSGELNDTLSIPWFFLLTRTMFSSFHGLGPSETCAALGRSYTPTPLLMRRLPGGARCADEPMVEYQHQLKVVSLEQKQISSTRNMGI